MKKTAEYLQAEFFQSTGINWKNSQGEPDIDYVAWLEKQIISQSSQVDELPSDAEIDLQAEKIHPFFKTNQYDRGRMDGWQKGAKFFRPIASAIIAKKDEEIEKLKEPKSVQEMMELDTLECLSMKEINILFNSLNEKIESLRKENEQLKQK